MTEKLDPDLPSDFSRQAAECFAVFAEVRYLALYNGRELHSFVRDDLSNASAAESDRYEELLVNPTLLALARQRGEIDCTDSSGA